MGECSGMSSEEALPSLARRRYTQSVAVGVFELTLPTSKTLFIDGNPELLGNGVDVVDVHVDERVRASVAFVLGEIKAGASSRDRDEPRQPRLELMLPLLTKSQPLIPRDCTGCILDIEDRDYCFVHTRRDYRGVSWQVGAMSFLRLPVEVAAPQLGISGDEVFEGLALWSVFGGLGDPPCPKPRQLLVELLGDAVMITALPRALHESLLGFERAVPPVENPGDTNVVEVTDPTTTEAAGDS
jgi:hypothetical protein